MNQQQKKGFSLVEVMILFTVLAVFLAASVPLITRKSNPIPNKITHGVYRCIRTNNGLMEELYSGTRRVKGPEFPAQCSFTVPSAALYRVDLYSAGAGGVKAALLSSQLDDIRSAVFNTNGTYTDFKGAMSGKGEDSILMKLKDKEIKTLLKGREIVRYFHSGNAGDGGDVIMNYRAPVDSVCNAQYYAQGFAGQRLQKAMNMLNPNSNEYQGSKLQKLEGELATKQGEVTTKSNEVDGYDSKLKAYNEIETKKSKPLANLKSAYNVFMSGSLVCDEKCKSTYRSLESAINLSELKDMLPGYKSALADAMTKSLVSRATSARDSKWESDKKAYINQKGQEAYNAAKEEGKSDEEANKAKSDAESAAEANASNEVQKDPETDFFKTVVSYCDTTCVNKYKEKGEDGLRTYFQKDTSEPRNSRAKAVRIEKGALSTEISLLKNIYNIASQKYDEYEQDKKNAIAPYTIEELTSKYNEASAELKTLQGQATEKQTEVNTQIGVLQKEVDKYMDESETLQTKNLITSGMSKASAYIQDREFHGGIDTIWGGGSYEYFPTDTYIYNYQQNDPRRANPAEKGTLKNERLDKTMIVFDLSTNKNSNVTAGDAARQVRSFCEAMYVRPYQNEFRNIANPSDFTSSKDRQVISKGGKGGKGKYVVLKFPLVFEPITAWGTNREPDYTNRKYLQDIQPPTKEDIQNNVTPNVKSYYPVYCKKLGAGIYTGDAENCIPAYINYKGEVDNALNNRAPNKGKDLIINYDESPASKVLMEKFFRTGLIQGKEGYTDFHDTAVSQDRIATGTEEESNGKTFSSGVNEYPYLAWHIPRFDISGPKNGFNIALMKTEPTPGKKASLGLRIYDESVVYGYSKDYVNNHNKYSNNKLHYDGTYDDVKNYNREPGKLNLKESITDENTGEIARTEAEAIGKSAFWRMHGHRIYTEYTYNNKNLAYYGGPYNYNPLQGQDATFYDTLYIQNYYDLPYQKVTVLAADYKNTAVDPLYRDYKITLDSGLWSKSYKLGRAGEPGNTESFFTTNLGSECTFVVPKGGPQYDINNPEKTIAELEKDLTVSITCTNRDKTKTVFYKFLDGGKYRRDYKIAEQKFNWFNGIQKVEIPGENGTRKAWQPTSMWAKAFSHMRANPNDDLYNRHNVGKGGDGTHITDKCVAPKGYYGRTLSEIVQFQPQAPRYLNLITQTNQLYSRKVYLDGEEDGVSCYGPVQAGKNYVENYSISEDDTSVEYNAGEGGPGAVVITW